MILETVPCSALNTPERLSGHQPGHHATCRGPAMNSPAGSSFPAGHPHRRHLPSPTGGLLELLGLAPDEPDRKPAGRRAECGELGDVYRLRARAQVIMAPPAATRRLVAIQSLSVAAVPGETGRGAVQDDRCPSAQLRRSGRCPPKSTGFAENSALRTHMTMPVSEYPCRAS
jgi:hypothetical protein